MDDFLRIACGILLKVPFLSLKKGVILRWLVDNASQRLMFYIIKLPASLPTNHFFVFTFFTLLHFENPSAALYLTRI